MPFWQMLLSWLLPVVETEVSTVLPIATKAVNDLAQNEVNAIATGDAKDTGHILAKAVQNTTTELAAAGISAGAPAVLTAVAHAISAVQVAAPPQATTSASDTPAAAIEPSTGEPLPTDDGTGHPGLVRSP